MRTLQELIDDAAFVHADAAIALREAVGDTEPTIDLRSATATFATPDGPLRFGIQLIGSDDSAGAGATGHGAAGHGALDALLGSGAGGTWEWGWYRPELVPPRMLDLARFVRDVGEREGIEAFAEPTLALDDYTATHLVVAAKGAAARIGSITVAGAPGVHVHLMLEGVGGGSPAVRHAAEAITTAFTQGLVEDHRRALHSYARIAKLRLVEPDGAVALLHAPGGHLELHFDDAGRVTRLEIRDDPDARAITAGAPDRTSPPVSRSVPADDVQVSIPVGWVEQAPMAAHPPVDARTPRPAPVVRLRIGDMPRLPAPDRRGIASPTHPVHPVAPPAPQPSAAPQPPALPPGFGIPPARVFGTGDGRGAPTA